MKAAAFWGTLAAIFVAGLALTTVLENEYYYNALYLILQAMLMAVAWNILGGFTGYVNFGSAAFFAMGAYTTVALNKALGLPLPLLILAGGAVGGLVGFGLGYLTLRLKGVYFAIATLAMAIVIETFIANWTYVGGARGSYMLTPDKHLWFDSYIQMLFMVMLLLTLGAVAVSRMLNSSRLGRGLAAIRDDEVAAESAGVPTLRLKLVSTTVMGGMMGVAGAPFPYFVTFVDPVSAFNLFIAVNAIAMPMIGGTGHWIGPVIGALLVGTTQEIVKVTVSSELNVLIVGVMLVVFITLAPQGIVGLVKKHWKRKP
ncbi:MAG: branched-chain amino acid ABC transporter permease [Betaproteobacteria bacterium]|nr:branched-chain amino acid ABC transporter permease [Betaproteobacteria bacterium]MDH4325040.1 branched-chain amino acid ABC transporter permease [Betaproteobacteria bacterium]MDH5210971.1 branched-chain amino acid ABC transporter permease [Betaproteobacteria bacterium]MDH5578727.1 branched-chain amino acid ABC transporter permease [Betaproteobacteria bacterium]